MQIRETNRYHPSKSEICSSAHIRKNKIP